MSRQTEGYISKYSKGFETGPTNYACTNIELVTIDSRKHDDRIEFKTELPISSITNNEYFGVSPLNLLFFRTLSLLEDTESNQSQSWWHRKETIQVDCVISTYIFAHLSFFWLLYPFWGHEEDPCTHPSCMWVKAGYNPKASCLNYSHSTIHFIILNQL